VAGSSYVVSHGANGIQEPMPAADRRGVLPLPLSHDSLLTT